jgi:hypothetical protein
MKRFVVVTLAIFAMAACKDDKAGDKPPPHVSDAGSEVPPGPEVVVFTGAPGWEGGRTCTDVRPEDGCDSQWLRTDKDGNGQVVRVFFVEVKDERALDGFVDKLARDVAGRGGVVDRFTQNGLVLVRFLEPRKDEKGNDLAAINYALIGRDKRAVHLITSIVDYEAQQQADQRVRDLLEHAAWAPKEAAPR